MCFRGQVLNQGDQSVTLFVSAGPPRTQTHEASEQANNFWHVLTLVLEISVLTAVRWSGVSQNVEIKNVTHIYTLDTVVILIF